MSSDALNPKVDLRDLPAGAASPASTAVDDRGVPDSAAVPEPAVPAASEPGHFGVLLQQARVSAGLSAAELATRLRLHERQINALERADLTALPALSFVRGFLRSACKELSIDPTPLLADLNARATAPEPELSAAALSAEPSRRGMASGTRVVMVLVAAVVLLAGGIGVFNRHHTAEPPVPVPVAAADPAPGATAALVPAPAAPAESQAAMQQPAVPALATAPAQVVPTPMAAPAQPPATAPALGAVTAPAAPRLASAPASPAPSRATPPLGGAGARSAPQALAAPNVAVQTTAAAANVRGTAGAPAGHLQLSVRADAWIDVRQLDGTVLLSRLMHKGESLSLVGHLPYAMVAGNAVYVDAQLDGKSVALNDHTTENGVARVSLP